MPYDVTPASRFEKALAGTLADPASREEKALMGQLTDPSNRVEALVNARASGGGSLTVSELTATGDGTGTITFQADSLPDDGVFILLRNVTNTTSSGTRAVLWGMIRRTNGTWDLAGSEIYTIYRLTSSVTFGVITPGISDIQYADGVLTITTASTESATYVFSQGYALEVIS